MIISQTPFRISFFGGGTDYPAWYEKEGGAVLSTAIDKYCYISCRRLPPFFEHQSRVVWSRIELVKAVDEIQHPSVREVLKFLGINDGVEVQIHNDVPARSGLGASSSFTVGLLNSLYALQGKIVSKRQLALDAIHIEQDRIKENVGSQDQAVAAFGGFNRIDFGGKEKISVHPITLHSDKLKTLQDHLMMFFTGMSRSASEIAAQQIKNIPAKTNDLSAMHAMVDQAVGILAKDNFIDDFGKLLHESWLLKRSLSSEITNDQINEIYEAGTKSGAIGGKLLGAGGGGFILFLVPPERQATIKERLKPLIHVPVQFENAGSRIIHYAPQQDVFA